jgi:hypothetical protein
MIAVAPPPNREQTAFIAAGLVLLVMPIVVAFGLGVISLVVDMIYPGMSKATILTAFAAWVLLVAAVISVIVARLVRRSSPRP